MTSRALKRFWNDRPMIGGVFLILISLFFFSVHFTKQKIETPSDLEIVQGKMLSYSFVDGNRGTHYYYIFLDGETSPYKIPADFLRYFDRSSFESMVHAGDGIEISFSKRLWVFSIADAKRSYLLADSTIKVYNKTDFQACLISFSLGLVLLVTRYFYNRSKLSLL